MTPLVSIIIPTYNRAHLIEETLNSVVAQTHTNWECIVVDDGSTDETSSIMSQYCAKDKRFRYYHRPEDRPRGGNAARNYGLKKTIGDYVIFFDSDDLMIKDHVTEKINAFDGTNYDFVIFKTKFFNRLDTYIENRYPTINNRIIAEDYIMQNINWLTYDVCIKASLAKSICFNEGLRSGQEYNYFSKLVLKSVNACFIEKYLTLRREHDNSIRSRLKNRSVKLISAYTSIWVTYLDIQYNANTKIKKGLLFRCIDMIFKNRAISFPFILQLNKEVFKVFGIWVGLNFVLMQFFNKLFKKGYSFRKIIVENIETSTYE